MSERQPFDPGRVELRLRIVDGRVAEAAVAGSRPAVARRLRGQPAEKAVALMPLLFSLCGRAQGEAARLALAAARGETVAPRHEPAVAREIAGEHLWRLLLDWPRLLGGSADEALFIEARRRLTAPDYGDWARARLAPAFDRLRESLAVRAEPGGPGAALLPPLEAEQTLALWPRLDETFAGAPHYRGWAAETGALARIAAADEGPSILSRVQARMAEALSLAPGQVSAASVAAGVGRAAVETARGLLMHELTLEGDRVADYVIVAPTEWNFNPAGPLAGWLQGLPEAAARELAPRAMLALDPCVPWKLEIAG